jgi:hypothetical protein
MRAARRVVRPLVLAVALVALAFPAAASSASSPALLAERVAKSSFKGAFGAQWDILHPTFKRVVSRARFIQCERKAAAGIGKLDIKSVNAEGTRVFSIKLPLLGKREVNGVGLAITYRRAGEKQDRIVEVELFWVAHRGKWARILVPADYQAYKAGRCP